MNRILSFVVVAAITIATTASAVNALTKAEAIACVNKGVGLFLSGGNVASMVDIDFMIEREALSAHPETVARAINARALENKNDYRNVKAVVVGNAFKSREDGAFFQVNGHVKGETPNREGEWEPFSYTYTIWMRPDKKRTCLIGVLSIEEIFRLGSWVREQVG